jgi:ABC-type Fe3+ transport system permease subunit
MPAAGVGASVYGTEWKGEAVLYQWMDGWDWLWMSLVMAFWAAVLGVVVYVAVKLATGR